MPLGSPIVPRRIATGLVVLCAAPLAGQSDWLDHQGDRVVGLEIGKPDFVPPPTRSLTAVAVFLAGRFTVRERTVLELEVPFARSATAAGSDNTIGNPYIGGEIFLRDVPVSIEAGVRLPLVSDANARGVGAFSDFDRFEAFADEVLPLSVLASYHWRLPTGVYARARAGPAVLLDLGDPETEVHLHYGVYGGFVGEKVDLTASVSGFGILTEPGSIGERTLWQAGAGAAVHLGSLRPGILVRFPIDEDAQRLLDIVFGAQIAVPLR